MAVLRSLAALAVAFALTARGEAADLHVCCGCGNDSADGTSRYAAVNSLDSAQARVRAMKPAFTTPQPIDVFVEGYCQLSDTLIFDHRDSGLAASAKITYKRYPGAADSPVVSGGVLVNQSALQPITDPAILNQLQPNARGNVVQVSLASLGVSDFGQLACRRYMGGDACILPANLVPTGLELFWYGDQTVNGDATPLTLARFPNRDYDTRNWTHVTKVGGPANMTIEVEADMATRLQGWVTQFNADPTSVYSHYQNPIGWADFHSEVTAVFPANGSITLGVCAGSGYSDLEVGGYLYVYNLLAEIDEPGEYSIDRTTGTVYVWPPNPAYFETSEWGLPVMGAEQVRHDHAGSAWLAGSSGAVSSGDSVIGAVSTLYDLLRFVNTQYLSFEGITFTFGRGVGLNFMGSSDITITDCVIENVGIMAVNVTGGSNVIIDSSSVRHAGNGGVFLYAGDRPTLTSSGHTISNSSLSYSNRYMYCYTPVVALGDCGNSIVGSEVYGGPHQGVFMSGNNHGLLTSYVHDVVQVVRDSGAFYTGRDWTYQGSRIENNTFARINTKLTGDDTSAVYLDDSASGYIITGNTFINCSRALLLGGGRWNIFANNTVKGSDGTDAAIHVDNRDMGWAASACAPGGILVQFLERVPYNTSQAWINAYPQLPSIMSDAPCVPKYNVIADNVICGDAGSLPWIDVNVTVIEGWGSTVSNNTVNTNC